jgi:hypothetical protein
MVQPFDQDAPFPRHVHHRVEVVQRHLVHVYRPPLHPLHPKPARSAAPGHSDLLLGQGLDGTAGQRGDRPHLDFGAHGLPRRGVGPEEGAAVDALLVLVQHRVRR